ncbi:MAG: helix-turn-helix transcriptional regulator [Deltaproteobacteria bacterium]|nr:helix-turn-helix transcriptional regulator [Deltaproteobacteria bacterium]
MFDFLNITKALADENRARALIALRGRELCLCQLVELLGLAPSTVSKHMAILRQARLIKGRKQGRWVYYRLSGDEAPAAVREALAWSFKSLAKSAEIEKDAARLKEILKLDPEVLCQAKRLKK